MLEISSTHSDSPWYIAGDFNLITSTEEKKGGIPYNMKKILEFISVIEGSGLMDLSFSSHKFT